MFNHSKCDILRFFFSWCIVKYLPLRPGKWSNVSQHMTDNQLLLSQMFNALIMQNILNLYIQFFWD